MTSIAEEKNRHDHEWYQKKKAEDPNYFKRYNARRRELYKQKPEFYRQFRKRFLEKHPDKARESYMKHRHRSDLSTRAKVIASRYGKLAEKCEQCPATEKLEMHHDDYLYPLEVRTLCKDCHEDWHVHNKALHQYDDPHLLDGRHCPTCIKKWPNCERANFHSSFKGRSCAFWTDRPWPRKPSGEAVQ